MYLHYLKIVIQKLELSHGQVYYGALLQISVRPVNEQHVRLEMLRAVTMSTVIWDV